MKAYLFGNIFYEKDIEYNKILLEGIRKAWPGIDIYAPQEAPFNDKRSFGDSKAIFEGDYNRLKEVDLLIGCLDSDLPPIGSTCEAGIFCAMAQENPNKQMIVLHTDTRDGYKTWSNEKFFDMAEHQCHNQMNYFNLFLTGTIENCGTIVGTKEQLFEYVHELYCNFLKTHHFSGIYMITNRVNNKKYIGQSIDVLARLNQHRFPSSNVIDQAIQKYGIENFTFEILEECNQNELCDRERYWCDEVYGCTTYVPNGYNIEPAGIKTPGVSGCVISCYSLEGEKEKTYPSIMAAARDKHCSKETIRDVLNNNKRTALNLLWCKGLEATCPPYEKPLSAVAKSVDVFDKTGVFLGTYPSLTVAARIHNTSISRASASYNTPGYTANNLLFLPQGEKPQLNKIKRKKIYCYDKRTRAFIEEYEGVTAAAEAVSGDKSAIGRAASGKQYYSHNYIWSYIKFDTIPSDFKNINSQYCTEVFVNEEDL